MRSDLYELAGFPRRPPLRVPIGALAVGVWLQKFLCKLTPKRTSLLDFGGSIFLHGGIGSNSLHFVQRIAPNDKLVILTEFPSA